MDSDATKMSAELQFHLGELGHDLRSARATCATVLAEQPEDAHAWQRVRHEVAGCAVSIEHAATHHARRAVELSTALAGGRIPPPVGRREEEPRADALDAASFAETRARLSA